MGGRMSRAVGSTQSNQVGHGQWMIEHGSDVHQGGDGPLMRATLQERIPMMELLVAHGANVNAEWHGEYPIIYSACEAVDPVALKWLLEHGANPNCDSLTRPYADTALDYRDRILRPLAGAARLYRHPGRRRLPHEVSGPGAGRASR